MKIADILRVSASPTAGQAALEQAARAAEALRKKAAQDVRKAEAAYRAALLDDSADPRRIAEIRSAAVARLEQRGALVDRLDARLLSLAIAALHHPESEDNLIDIAN